MSAAYLWRKILLFYCCIVFLTKIFYELPKVFDKYCLIKITLAIFIQHEYNHFCHLHTYNDCVELMTLKGDQKRSKFSARDKGTWRPIKSNNPVFHGTYTAVLPPLSQIYFEHPLSFSVLSNALWKPPMCRPLSLFAIISTTN